MDRAYALIDSMSSYKKNNKMVLYGGEPLLKENKSIVSYIVQKGHERGYKFIAITNGYEIDAYKELLSPELIYKLQITVDGMKETHDKHRVHYRDKSTFDKIMQNILQALQCGVEVTVRVNSDSSNISELQQLRNFFSDSGFYDYPLFSMYSSILRDYDSIPRKERDSINFISPKSYAVESGKNDDICNDYGISKMFYNALTHGKPVAFQTAFCLAQLNGYVLSPYGDIYPCWEVINDEKNRIGIFDKDGVVWNDSVLKKWRQANVLSYKDCSKCKFALFCGGGCPSHRMVSVQNRALTE